MSTPDGLLLEVDEARVLLELAGRTRPRNADELRLLAGLVLAVVHLTETTPTTKKEAPR